MVSVLAIIASNNSSVRQLEALDACFAAAVFDINISVLVLGNNIKQLLRTEHNDPSIGKNLSRQWASADLYDIDKLYVLEADLNAQAYSRDAFIDNIIVLRDYPDLKPFKHVLNL